MSPGSFRYEDPAHHEVMVLLPWLVNRTLEDQERQRVERHVSQCVACRRELEAARALQAAVASEEDDPAMTDSLARMQALLQEEEGLSLQGLRRALARRWNEVQPWARRALGTQFVVIALLGGALAVAFVAARPAPALYRTLGGAPPTVVGRSAVAVVFKGETSEQQIRRLLSRIDARMVDGPSPAGAYTLEVREGEELAALTTLRADPAVAFAEPVSVLERRSR